MKISIIGAGAIGCVTAALLHDAGKDVTLIGRADQVDAINGRGLTVSIDDGEKTYNIPAATKLDGTPDVVLLAVKSNDVEAACKSIAWKLGDAPVLTMQNGVCSDDIAGEILGRQRIVSSVVMYGATYLEPGRVDYNFPGGLLVGKAFDETEDRALDVVRNVLKGGLDVTVVPDIHGVHWMKLILNLNNSLAGVLGRGLDEIFTDARLCTVGVTVMKEAYGVMTHSGVRLAPLPDLPLERLESLLFAPEEIGAEVYGKIMTGLSRSYLPGSVLQSIKRGKPPEVDYLNGEVVALAERNGMHAPVNGLLTRLVKKVAANGRYMDTLTLLDEFDRVL
jgi:2-dehydropantoate 2-reductase